MIDFKAYDCLTFDCYGTLIDWETGLLDVLRPIMSEHNVAVDDDAVLTLFAELEHAAEAGPYLRYREVLRHVMVGLGQRLGFTPSAEEIDRLPESVRRWPPFPDSPEALAALKRRYRLAVISNIDDDLFAGSAAMLGVTFDWVITAQQVGSYKPSHRNFQAALERIGLPREKVLHVAQSLFHDIAPAKELGLAAVWVNRRQGKAGTGATLPAGAHPDLEVPDLRTLASLAGAG